MSAMQWFRFYHEFAGDPIVQCLAFEDQRHYVMALCLKSEGVLDREYPSAEYRRRVISKALGLDVIAAAEACRRLAEAGLVDDQWQPLAWDRRQFISDSSTARVRKFRAASESQEEPKSKTDTEGNVTRNVSETLPLHESLPQVEWGEWLAMRKQRRWPCDATTLRKQLTLLAAHDAAVQREMLNNSMQAGWQGLFPPKSANGSRGVRRTRFEEITDGLRRGGNDATGA